MKVKEGDILICSKPKRQVFGYDFIFFRSDPEPDFTDGKKYKVEKIAIGNTCSLGPKPYYVLAIFNDKRSIRFLNNNEILPDTNLGRIFLNIKQQRKLKLKKIQNGILY
jgi:hypothetical protein